MVQSVVEWIFAEIVLEGIFDPLQANYRIRDVIEVMFEFAEVGLAGKDETCPVFAIGQGTQFFVMVHDVSLAPVLCDLLLQPLSLIDLEAHQFDLYPEEQLPDLIVGGGYETVPLPTLEQPVDGHTTDGGVVGLGDLDRMELYLVLLSADIVDDENAGLLGEDRGQAHSEISYHVFVGLLLGVVDEAGHGDDHRFLHFGG